MNLDLHAGMAPSAALRVRRLLHVLIVGALTLAPALPLPTLHAQSLPKRLDRRLDTPPFDKSLWGVAVVDHKGKLLYGRNERRLFTPASNTKLVVTAVASALLPPDFTVRTSLYAAGPVVGGVLRGDLVLYGRGDPTFSRRCYATDTLAQGVCDKDPFARLRQLADTLQARGVRQVEGDVVGDGSWFEATSLHPGWELFDLNWWYAAPVSGLAFNDNSLDFVWQPGIRVGAPALISMWPDLGDIAFENRTVTVPAGGETDIGDRFFRQPGTAQVWAEGTVAIDRSPRKDRVVRGERSQPLRRPCAPAGAGRRRDRRHGHHPVHRRLRTLRRGARPAAAGGDRLPAGARLDLPDPQHQSESLRRDAAQAAGQALRAGRLLGGGPPGGAPLPDRLGADRLHRVLPLGWIRAFQCEPDLAPRLHPATALYPGPPALHHLRGRTAAVRAAPATCAPASWARRSRAGCGPRPAASPGSTRWRGTSSGRDGRPITFAVEVNHHAQPSRAVLAAIDSVVVEMAKGKK